jgi:heptosyltransferase-2
MKILVLRLSSIGDILLVTPFLRSVKRRFPESTVDFCVMEEYAELLAGHACIDNLIKVKRSSPPAELRSMNAGFKKEKYDITFDLHSSHRTSVLRRHTAPDILVIRKRHWRWMLLVAFGIDAYGEVVTVPERAIAAGSSLGLEPDNAGPQIHLTDAELVDAITRVERVHGVALDNTIAICPGSRHETKRWPVAHFAEFARRVIGETGLNIVVLGDASDRPAGTALGEIDAQRVAVLCGELSLRETAAVVSRCRAAVTNDSGLMHLATAMSVPVIALFGSTVRQFGFFPYNSCSVVHEVEHLECRPCTHIGRPRCPRLHMRCLNDIDPNAVYLSLRRVLELH